MTNTQEIFEKETTGKWTDGVWTKPPAIKAGLAL